MVLNSTEIADDASINKSSLSKLPEQSYIQFT